MTNHSEPKYSNQSASSSTDQTRAEPHMRAGPVTASSDATVAIIDTTATTTDTTATATATSKVSNGRGRARKVKNLQQTYQEFYQQHAPLLVTNPQLYKQLFLSSQIIQELIDIEREQVYLSFDLMQEATVAQQLVASNNTTSSRTKITAVKTAHSKRGSSTIKRVATSQVQELAQATAQSMTASSLAIAYAPSNDSQYEEYTHTTSRSAAKHNHTNPIVGKYLSTVLASTPEDHEKKAPFYFNGSYQKKIMTPFGATSINMPRFRGYNFNSKYLPKYHNTPIPEIRKGLVQLLQQHQPNQEAIAQFLLQTDHDFFSADLPAYSARFLQLWQNCLQLLASPVATVSEQTSQE